MTTVAGGIYREVSEFPADDRVYGSGGRAAALLSRLSGKKVSLVSYVGDDIKNTAYLLSTSWRTQLRAEATKQAISFQYYHGLSSPVIRPTQIAIQKPLVARDDIVLRFGMLEGSAIVDGERVVYDPQNPAKPERFEANGSSARKLAYVLNAREALKLTRRRHLEQAAEILLSKFRADVVVIKASAIGAYIATPRRTEHVAAYKTRNVWPIGSGDVFAAAFTYFWAEQRKDPIYSAKLASRAAALYCDLGDIPADTKILTSRSFPFPKLTIKRQPKSARIYLAGPFFTMAQRWLIEEARSTLTAMGYRVFSPLHDVGVGNAEEVVQKDLSGLRKSDVALAICDGLDPGTLFEIGYAVNEGIPVVAFTQDTSEEAMKMLKGTHCSLHNDFTTSIYKACWLALE